MCDVSPRLAGGRGDDLLRGVGESFGRDDVHAAFGVYCIWNDAYMNLNQKPWSVHLMFGVLALCNLGIAENNQRIGTLFADGKLGFGAVNLVFAVMFIVFEIVFFIKRSREKRDLSEEKAE